MLVSCSILRFVSFESVESAVIECSCLYSINLRKTAIIMEQSSGILPHPNLVSEFEKLKCQVQRSEPVNAATVNIEEEADFVNEVILKVGKQTDSVRQVRCFTENFSPEYLSFLPSDPKFREQISGLVTPEDRVGFAQKYFSGLRTDVEVVSSKSFYKNLFQVTRSLSFRKLTLFFAQPYSHT